MESQTLFCNITSNDFCELIHSSEKATCYAAPGMFSNVAHALVELSQRIGPELVSISLDIDEHVFRMGYGEFASIKLLRDAGVIVNHAPALRSGIFMTGDTGYIFTPTALYLEPEISDAISKNAVRMSQAQIREAWARVSPTAKIIAIAAEQDLEAKAHIQNIPVELGITEVTNNLLDNVEEQLNQAPPVKFDLVRQVRVFEPYLQYVDITLAGAAIQRHKLAIPASLQKLGGGEDLEGRLKTTFDLIEKNSALSSKPIDKKLKEIRDNFTPSLGKEHGRIVLKCRKPLLDERISDLRHKLAEHRDKIKSELEEHLESSKKAVVNYYLPLAINSPPDEFLGKSMTGSDTELESWLCSQLDKVFPSVASLISEMKLEVTYKDVTFETLNNSDFVEAVKRVFEDSGIDWEKTYKAFIAAGQSDNKNQKQTHDAK